MISASKTAYSLNNLKILMPKVTKILRICLTLKTVVNFEPVSYISSPTDVEGKVKKRSDQWPSRRSNKKER